MNLEHPLARVIGKGSAKSGVDHWWMQRLTAIALVPLTLWVIVMLLKTQGMDYYAVRDLLSIPLNAAFLVLWVVAMIWHAQLGLQVVIEDYIHNPWVEFTALVVVKFAALVGIVLSTIAVLKIATGGA